MRRASVALLAAAGLALGGCATDDDPDAPGQDVTVEDGVEDLGEEVEDGAEAVEDEVDGEVDGEG